jgi:hypothetical protein
MDRDNGKAWVFEETDFGRFGRNDGDLRLPLLLLVEVVLVEVVLVEVALNAWYFHMMRLLAFPSPVYHGFLAPVYHGFLAPVYHTHGFHLQALYNTSRQLYYKHSCYAPLSSASSPRCRLEPI